MKEGLRPIDIQARKRCPLVQHFSARDQKINTLGFAAIQFLSSQLRHGSEKVATIGKRMSLATLQ